MACGDSSDGMASVGENFPENLIAAGSLAAASTSRVAENPCFPFAVTSYRLKVDNRNVLTRLRMTFWQKRNFHFSNFLRRFCSRSRNFLQRRKWWWYGWVCKLHVEIVFTLVARSIKRWFDLDAFESYASEWASELFCIFRSTRRNLASSMKFCFASFFPILVFYASVQKWVEIIQKLYVEVN